MLRRAEDSKATSMGAEELVDILRDPANQKDEAQSGVVSDKVLLSAALVASCLSALYTNLVHSEPSECMSLATPAHVRCFSVPCHHHYRLHGLRI